MAAANTAQPLTPQAWVCFMAPLPEDKNALTQWEKQQANLFNTQQWVHGFHVPNNVGSTEQSWSTQTNGQITPLLGFTIPEEKDYYQQCRELAQASVDWLEQDLRRHHLNDIILTTENAYGELKPLLRFQLQLLFLSQRLPFWINTLQQALKQSPHNKPQKIILVDTTLPAPVLQALLGVDVECQSNPDSFKQWQKSIKALQQPKSPKVKARATSPIETLIVSRQRSGNDWKLCNAVIDESSATILCPQSFITKSSHLAQLNPQPNFITFEDWGINLLQPKSISHAIAEQNKLLKSNNNHYLLPYFQLINHLHLKGLQYTHAISQLKPKQVIGCFDIAVDGLILNSLKTHYNFKLSNVQHGTMACHNMMDQFDFDEHHVWLPSTQQLLLKDGFKYPQRIKLMQNPLWESLKQQVKHYQSNNPSAEQNITTFYSQSGKTFDTPLELLQAVTELCKSLVHHNGQKLMIKCHPLESNPPYDWLLKQLPESLKQNIIYNKTMSLVESLCSSKQVTSLFSTVLLDAKMVGIPAFRSDSKASQKANPLDMDAVLNS